MRASKSKLGNQRTLFLSVFSILILVLSISLSGCTSSSDSSSDVNWADEALDLFTDSANVSLVKNSSIKACPTATLDEMANGFMSSPRWSEFTSTTGTTVVELSGEISYDGVPATALIQFEISGGSFEAKYLSIADEPQSLIAMNVLFNKMCESA
jgi:hypothetical protein